MLIDTEKMHELIEINRAHSGGDQQALTSADRFASALFLVEEVARRTGLVERPATVVQFSGLPTFLSRDEVAAARRFARSESTVK